ncbi:hypothetical protein BGZ65_009209 [Modicella reniformis]|uniref:Uncharacterized protein n=1 Tax=Modicella reniformis TaxID=1440133 RepID=A0A9P6LU20_9FUNG|nr:hypothetical protein BGZ65_009209 [Modicella reniformis]
MKIKRSRPHLPHNPSSAPAAIGLGLSTSVGSATGFSGGGHSSSSVPLAGSVSLNSTPKLPSVSRMSKPGAPASAGSTSKTGAVPKPLATSMSPQERLLKQQQQQQKQQQKQQQQQQQQQQSKGIVTRRR